MHTPPKTPLKILRWFCTDERLEEIEGDLFEAYQDWRQTKTKPRANWLYWWTVIRSFRLYLMKKRTNTPSMFSLMTKHFVKTAWRELSKHKSVAIINLFGLSLGMACCLLMGIYIYEQTQFDSFFEDKEQVYRLEGTNTSIESGNTWSIHPGIAETLAENIPEVIDYCKVNRFEREFLLLTESSRQFFREKTVIADPNFFSFFPFEIIYGNPQALSDKNSLVVSERFAEKLGGIEKSIGKKLIIEYDNSSFTIAAVMKNPPLNSSIQFNIAQPLDIDYGISSQGYSPAVTFLKTTKGTDVKALEKKIQPTILANSDNNVLEGKNYELFAWNDLRFRKEVLDGVINVTDKNVIALFTIVGALILILSISNYVNLTASRALQKGSESGMRKILGAGRSSFMLQYIIESLLSCLLALPFALLLLQMAIPYFESVIGRGLIFEFWSAPSFYLACLAGTFFIALIGGLYPSLLVANFKYSDFLKGKLTASQKGKWFKNGLIIFQFAITVTLITCAITVRSQLKHIQNETLSFHPDQVLVLDRIIAKDFDAIKKEFSNIASVQAFSLTSSPPGGDSRFMTARSQTLDIPIIIHRVDEHYFDLLDLKLLSGNNFDPIVAEEHANDVIINESMAQHITSTNPLQVENPLDHEYDFQWKTKGKIIGIVEDFQMESAHNKVEPMVFSYEAFKGYTGAWTLLKVNTSNTPATLKQIEETWYRVYPNKQLRYQFLSSRFEQLYTEETKLAKTFNAFTVSAAIISLLGLLGLIGFIVESRTQEIGIRKVMGADATQVISIFVKQVYILVGIGCLIGIPISVYLGNLWLQNYALRVKTPYLAITIITLLIFIVTGLTVSLRARKAANLNPIHTLRNE
ncbi:ABC transporter permease [Roseivirga pacifica]